MQLKGKVTIIFGGGKDIGEEIVKLFVKEGSTVIIADLDESAGKKLTQELKKDYLTSIEFVSVNIVDEEQVNLVINKVIQEHKKIDILINNIRGDRFREKQAFDYSIKEWLESFKFILGGAYLTTKYTIPHMQRLKKGVILNISSISGFLIGDESMNYHIAKAGLTQFTKYVAAKYGSENIRANSVSLGFIVKDKHKMTFESSKKKHKAISVHPLRKVGTNLDVANAVLFLCSDDSGFITGENLIVDGGLTIQDQWSVINREVD